MGMETDAGGRWPHAGACAAVGAMGSVHVAKDVSVSFPLVKRAINA